MCLYFTTLTSAAQITLLLVYFMSIKHLKYLKTQPEVYEVEHVDGELNI